MAKNPQQFYYKNNRLQQMRGFCYAAQFGCISKAAKHLNLMPSSVSLQIKALEKDLGVELFKRNGPSITLTSDGERFLRLALPHVDAIQNIVENFSSEKETENFTTLRIAVNSTTKNFLMPSIITKMIEVFPDFNFTLLDAEHDEAVESLLADEIDVAALPFRDYKPIPPLLIYVPIYTCQACLMTAKGHPLSGRKFLSLEEICQYDLILPDKNLQVISNLNETFTHHVEGKTPKVKFLNSETGRAFVEEGIVVTISSNIWVSDNDPLIDATPVSHIFPDVSYGYILRKEDLNMPKIQHLITQSKLDAKLRNRSGVH